MLILDLGVWYYNTCNLEVPWIIYWSIETFDRLYVSKTKWCHVNYVQFSKTAQCVLYLFLFRSTSPFSIPNRRHFLTVSVVNKQWDHANLCGLQLAQLCTLDFLSLSVYNAWINTSAFRPFFRELLGYRFFRRGRNQHSLCQLAG